MPENNEPANTDSPNADADAGTKATDSNVNSVDQLPKWAQDELSRARNDAAKYRERLKNAKAEVESEVRGAVEADLKRVNDENAELKLQVGDASLAHTKLSVALEVGVPGEQAVAFAERLRGSTSEELKADAETVKATFGVGSGRVHDTSAGLGNTTKSSPSDVFAQFVTERLNNK
jgi:hypothetical protein